MSSFDLFFNTRTQQTVVVTKSDTGYSVTHNTDKASDIAEVDPETLTIKKQPLYVVDSVNSGTGRLAGFSVYKTILRTLFDDLDVSHTYIDTKSRHDIGNFAAKLEGDATVILISGDTSVTEFVNGLNSEARVQILVVPSGTGNSLALSVGIESEVEAVRKIFTFESLVPLHTYEAIFPNGSKLLVQDEEAEEVSSLKFLVVFSWAFHAALVADSDTPELRKHGLERFKLAAAANLANEQKYTGQFESGSSTYSGPFAYFLLTPSRRFEPTFLISPKGNLHELSLYLVSFQDSPDIMEIMGQVYSGGKHVENPKVTYEKISHGVLTVDGDRRHRRVCVDGSIILLGGSGPVNVSIGAIDTPGLLIVI